MKTSVNDFKCLTNGRNYRRCIAITYGTFFWGVLQGNKGDMGVQSTDFKPATLHVMTSY